MNILNESFDYLTNNGYNPNYLGDSAVRFSVSGITCLLFWDVSDSNFLKIDARYEISQFNTTTEALLRKCNKINKERKVIKAHIDYDENVLILSAEVLLDLTPEIESLLHRLISMITGTSLILMM